MSDSDFTDADPWADLDADSFTPTPPAETVIPPTPVVEEIAAPPVDEPPALPPMEDVVAPPLDADLDALTSGLGDVAAVEQVTDATDDDSEGLDVGGFDLDDLNLDALASEAPLAEAPSIEPIEADVDVDVDLDEISATLAEVDGVDLGDFDLSNDEAADDLADLEITEESDDMDAVLAELDEVPEPGAIAPEESATTEPEATEAPSTTAPPRMSPFLASSGLFGNSAPLVPTEPHPAAEAQPPEELQQVVSDLELEDVAESDLEFDNSSVPSAYHELEDLSGVTDLDEALAAVEISETFEEIADPAEVADVSLDDTDLAAISFDALAVDESEETVAEVADHTDVTPDDTDLTAISFDALAVDESEETVAKVADDTDTSFDPRAIDDQDSETDEVPTSIEMGDIDFASLESEGAPGIEIAEPGAEEDEGPVFGAVLGSGGDAPVQKDDSDDLDLGVSFGFGGDEATAEAEDISIDELPASLDDIDLSGITGSKIEFTDLAADGSPLIDMGISSEPEDSATDMETPIESQPGAIDLGMDGSSADEPAVTDDDEASGDAVSVDAADDELVEFVTETTEQDGDIETPAETATDIDDDFSALAALVADVEPTVIGHVDASRTLKETDELSWLDDELKSDVVPVTDSTDEVPADEALADGASIDMETDTSLPEPVVAVAEEAIDDFDIPADPFSMTTPDEAIHGDVDEIAEASDAADIVAANDMAIDSSADDVPNLDVPDLDVPELDVPDLEAPDLDVPDLDVPDLEAPDLDVPEVAMPEIEVPDTMPDFDAITEDLNADTFDAAVPDIAAVDMSTPPIDTPVEMEATGTDTFVVPPVEVETPDITVPDMSLPDMSVPDIAMAGTALVGTAVAAASMADGPDDTPDEAVAAEDLTIETSEEAAVSDEWGAKWQESLQGWVPDEEGQRVWRPIVTTSQELSDFVIEKYLGVVFGDASVDVSGASEQAISRARQTATAAMVAEAMTRGAHAVIAVAINVQTVGNKVLVTGTGTAVALIEQPVPEEPA